MSRFFQTAAAAAVGLTALAAVAVTVPGVAQESLVEDVLPSALVIGEGSGIADDLPALVAPQPPEIAPAPALPEMPLAPVPQSLPAKVAALAQGEPDSPDMRCIATGVYYESRAESLEGQLAVANVIISRADSGRFAPSACGVLTQRGQFSFVRGGAIPTPPNNAQWRTAVAIARIAMDGQWRNPVPGAMFFHASHVSPGWNRPRVARLGNHIFYR